MVNGQVREILFRVADKWDDTEALVKKAEILTGDAVGATMFELRYAGRRLVDAVREALADEPDPNKVLKDVREVEGNCERAHHDAIDAIVYYLRSSVKLSEETFGPDLLLDHWPGYLKAKAALDRIGLIVVDSRQDRAQRQELYEAIRKDDIPNVLELIAELTHSEDALKAIAERRRQDEENRLQEAADRADEAERSSASLAVSNRNLKIAVWTLGVTVVLGLLGAGVTLYTAGGSPPGPAVTSPAPSSVPTAPAPARP